jgi:quaternary ammonium compound-resistance protein SugE
MAWIYLLIAGLLEIVWAIGIKYTAGFTKPIPSILTISAMAASMYLLALAVRSLPIGTAYAVWVGIGATGAAIFGILLLGEPATTLRLLFIAMLLISIIGLKLTAQ